MKLRSTYVYTAQRASRSALDLANAMGIMRIKTINSKFKPGKHKTIINWGVSNLNFELDTFRKVLNDPSTIAVASNKLTFFQFLQSIPVKDRPNTPVWTEDINVAKQWQAEGIEVVCRQSLTGHSGAGIVICGKDDEVPKAPLYTQYIKKKDEYRVHFVKEASEPFVQRKVRVMEVEDPNWKVRNLSGGFRYANSPENVGTVPVSVITESTKAFELISLDFCCVDVLYNEHDDKASVLEINTAPGLMGRTLKYYSENLSRLVERTL